MSKEEDDEKRWNISPEVDISSIRDARMRYWIPKFNFSKPCLQRPGDKSELHLRVSSAGSDEWGLSISPQFLVSADYAMLVFPKQIMQCNSSTSNRPFRSKHTQLVRGTKGEITCLSLGKTSPKSSCIRTVVSVWIDSLEMRQKRPHPTLADHNVITKMSSWCLQKTLDVFKGLAARSDGHTHAIRLFHLYDPFPTASAEKSLTPAVYHWAVPV